MSCARPPVRQLSEALQNRIAAGEVVERPASVVKELVENALDAGAQQIDVVIRNGGKDLIRVSDDGVGMSMEDLALCVERHATSKLPSDDLLDIRFLGFRGEALPSIGSVSHLTITTRHASAPHGWALEVKGGRKGDIQPAAQQSGTRVEVCDLFYAVPARLKFLKSERSENIAISQIIERLALAAPHVRFSLTLEDRPPRVYAVQAELASDETHLLASTRLIEVLGREAAQDLIPLNAVREGVHLRGFISLPATTRATAREQFLFVNQRAVRDRLILGALKAAYGDTIPRDRHPIAVLFLDLDPFEVDVNVHPAKAEVRFRDAGLVRGLLIGAIRQSLAEHGRAPAMSQTGAAIRLAQQALTTYQMSSASAFAAPPADIRYGTPPHQFHENAQSVIAAWAPAGRAQPPETASSTLTDESYPLGAAKAQIHATYIVAQASDGLVLVDQHAAHERLVYERLKSAWTAQGMARQILLIPEIIYLNHDEADALLAAAMDLERWGLVLEAFGIGAVVVREVPTLLRDMNIKGLVKDLAGEVLHWERSKTLEDRLWAVASRMACHGSVRAGRHLRMEEMNALLREIETTPNAATCNHGRPTFVKLGKSEIEKLFARR